MQLLSILIPLAMASGALSHVLGRNAASACAADDCARAVTGTGAMPDMTQRQSDCNNFLAWPSAAVPSYASACSDSVRYVDSGFLGYPSNLICYNGQVFPYHSFYMGSALL